MQAIADAIGVTQPAIFRHFKNKEALWLAVMDWFEGRLEEIYAAGAIDDKDRAATLLPTILWRGRGAASHRTGTRPNKRAVAAAICAGLTNRMSGHAAVPAAF